MLLLAPQPGLLWRQPMCLPQPNLLAETHAALGCCFPVCSSFLLDPYTALFGKLCAAVDVEAYFLRYCACHWLRAVDKQAILAWHNPILTMKRKVKRGCRNYRSALSTLSIEKSVTFKHGHWCRIHAKSMIFGTSIARCGIANHLWPISFVDDSKRYSELKILGLKWT